MICPKCNTQNQEGTQFCINCGSPLTVAVPTPITTSVQPVPQSQTKNIFKPLIIALSIILILGVVLGITIFSLSQSQKTSSGVNAIPSNSSQPQNFGSTKDKYDIDSNGDGVPDFVEVALNQDPTIDACLAKLDCGADFSNLPKTQSNILVILDASGSMAESISGTTKINIARQALTSFLDKVSADVNIGLMVYGHKGSNSSADKALSCQGIDIIYPLSILDKDKFLQAINSFNPTGWTPIGGSLRKAKDEVFSEKSGQNNSILLITDGVETCDSDPLGAVEELKNSGIKPVIDVIGLAVDQSSATQLKQISDRTGGTYVTANNYDDLLKSINNSYENTKKYLDTDFCINKHFLDYQFCFNKKYIEATAYLSVLAVDLRCPGSSADECSKIEKSIDLLKKVNEIGNANSISEWKKTRQELINQYKKTVLAAETSTDMDPCNEWNYDLYPIYPSARLATYISGVSWPNPWRDSLGGLTQKEKEHRIITCHLRLVTDSSYEDVVSWYQNFWLSKGFENCPDISNDNPGGGFRTFSKKESSFYSVAQLIFNEKLGYPEAKNTIDMEMTRDTKPFCGQKVSYNISPLPSLLPSFGPYKNQPIVPRVRQSSSDNWLISAYRTILVEPFNSFTSYLKNHLPIIRWFK